MQHEYSWGNFTVRVPVGHPGPFLGRRGGNPNPVIPTQQAGTRRATTRCDNPSDDEDWCNEIDLTYEEEPTTRATATKMERQAQNRSDKRPYNVEAYTMSQALMPLWGHRWRQATINDLLLRCREVADRLCCINEDTGEQHMAISSEGTLKSSVQYHALGMNTTVCIPTFSCSCCKKPIEITASHVGCVSPQPIKSSVWIDRRVTDLFTMLNLKEGLSAQGTVPKPIRLLAQRCRIFFDIFGP